MNEGKTNLEKNELKNEHEFDLVKGRYEAEEGGYLILSLLHQKIDFLTLKSLSQKNLAEGHTAVIEYMQQLSDQGDTVRDLVMQANAAGRKVNINCRISIELE